MDILIKYEVQIRKFNIYIYIYKTLAFTCSHTGKSNKCITESYCAKDRDVFFR